MYPKKPFKPLPAADVPQRPNTLLTLKHLRKRQEGLLREENIQLPQLCSILSIFHSEKIKH